MRKIVVPLTIIFGVSALVYHSWLNFGVFTYSDWLYTFSETLKDMLAPTAWLNTYNNNLGGFDFTLWQLPIKVLYGLFGSNGFSLNVADKFLFFWQVAFLPPIFSFFLIKAIFRSSIVSIAGSFIFAFNTYFLSINTQGHEQLTVGFTWAVLALLFFIKSLEKKSLVFLFLTNITLIVVGAYDLRCLYIALFTLVAYGIYVLFVVEDRWQVRKRIISLLCILIFIVVLSNLYWLLPTLVAHALTSNPGVGRQLSFGEWYKLFNTISLFFPFWTGAVPKWDTYITVPWYFWLYPIFAVGGVVKNKKRILPFFAIISLVGIFLAKQTDIPFTGSYIWLYNNIPGFNAFREASKFYFLIVLGYSVLIAGFIDWMLQHGSNNKKTYIKYIIVFLIFFMALWNTRSLVTGNMKTLFVEHHVPGEYITLKNFILEQPDYFKTFWIHRSNFWVISTRLHPELDGDEIVNGPWYQVLNWSSFEQDDSKGKRLVDILQTKKAVDLLSASSVKYIIVPLYDKETNDSIQNGFGMNYSFYQKKLKENPYLSQAPIGSSDLLVLENKYVKPHIYLSKTKEVSMTTPTQSVLFKAVNPILYNIKFDHLSKPVYLHFTDTFNENWLVHTGSFNWVSLAIVSHYNYPQLYHEKDVGGLNEYYVDPEIIKKNTDKSNYTVNKDGSINVDATLYFKPQLYLYIGMIISSITLLVIFVYLFYNVLKRYGKRIY